MVLAAKPTLVYFDPRKALGPYGFVGNVPRLFMLANGIEFEDRFVSFQEWGAGEKARIAESLEQPAGKLPVLRVGGKSYPESLAISRMIARENGLYGKDIDLDFEVDAVADVQSTWRMDWTLTFKESAESPKVKKYLEDRENYYKTLNGFYERRSAKDSPYVVKGDKPSFADIAVYNLIRDDMLTHGKVNLAKWPNLEALFEAVGTQPTIEQWIKNWEADAVEPVRPH